MASNNRALSQERRNWPKIIGWTVLLPLLMGAWEISARILDQPWILPRATVVAGQLVHPFRDHYASGSLFSNTIVSFVRALVGFLLGALVGVSLGLVMGSVRVVRGLLEPLVELLRPLCPIAWIPFAIAVFKLRTIPQLFGVRFTGTILDQVQVGMIFVLFWGAFLPVVINTIDGVAGVRRNYLMLAQTLGANRRQIFIHVYLPAAMPMILTGLRQGIGTCWMVIIAAEMLPGASNGIGYLLMYAADQSGMDIVIASMVIIAAIGASLNALLLYGARPLVKWYGKEV
ncbi:MAG: ABC transporter permease [Lentisphaerales bacterium]|nr:MAG: ABC transporter permease [Lentisphaerales bacterium]